MLKNNSGITLTALIFMVIILLILSSVFIATGLSALNDAKDTNIQAEKKALEEAISIRYASYLKNDANVALPGDRTLNIISDAEKCVNEVLKYITFDNMTEDQKEQKRQLIIDNITEDYNNNFVKVIDASDAKSLGVEPFSADNKYIVDYATSSVFGPITE